MSEQSNTTAQQALDAVPDSVLSKIQKMLALAESATNTTAEHRQAEAANALAMAQALLQKWNLDISTVQGHKVQDDSLGEVKDTSFAMPSKKMTRYGPNRTRADQPWIEMIANAVARGSFCKVLVNKYTVFFIGRARNVEASMYMFSNVLDQVQDLARIATKANNARLKALGAGDMHYQTGEDNPIVYRNSWLLGAASTIQTRLNAQRAEFERTSATSRPTDGSAPVVHTGMEVVLAADTEVDDYIDEKWNGGRARKRREWQAKWAAEQAERTKYLEEHPEERVERSVIVDARADKQRASDARKEERESERRRERERNFFRKHGRHSWEQAPQKERQMNSDAYYQGLSDAKRVSLDGGKVNGAERKQLGK